MTSSGLTKDIEAPPRGDRETRYHGAVGDPRPGGPDAGRDGCSTSAEALQTEAVTAPAKGPNCAPNEGS